MSLSLIPAKQGDFIQLGHSQLIKPTIRNSKTGQGYFLQKYESSEDMAVPIFRKNETPQVQTELPRIIVK